MGGDVPANAGKLSELIGAAVHRASVAAAPHVQAAHDERITTFLEGLEARIAPLLAPLLADVLADPNTPEQVRPLLEAVAAPAHKFDSSLIGIGLAALLYPFLQAATAPAVLDVQYGANSLSHNTKLSVAELALSQIKNTYDRATAFDDARAQGLSPARFQTMIDNTGNPPGIAELLLLYRRGQIDDAKLLHGIRQSHIRDEWADEIKALRFAPPPAGEVVAGRLKQHLSDADYRDKLGEAGINPANADWMLATAGRPYGIQQALHLLNRGEIDEGRVRQVVAQSDINTVFTDDILQLRWYLPPVRSIMAMLRSGAITDAKATELFTENGVRSSDITGYLAEAHHGRTATVRTLTEAQVVRMYGAKFLPRATALAKLQTLGYDATTADTLLDFADEAQTERYTNAVITRVHARYVAYKLTDAEATNALNADAVPPAAQHELMRLWRIERDANIHVLSPAQVVAAYRRTQIGPAETKRRLLAAGVQQSDLAIVVADAFPPSEFKPASKPATEALVAAVVNA